MVMDKERMFKKEKLSRPRRAEVSRQEDHEPAEQAAAPQGLSGLQRQIGNQAVQRLLMQRSAQEPVELDAATADRIQRERGGGQPLNPAVQASMGEAMGADLSEVQVHTSPESDALNRQLGARAFTTGQDVFFREGAYDPHSTGGQELIAHELTHVAQQQAGQAGGAGRMTVNAPGDAYEQEADATAKTIVSGSGAGGGARSSTNAGAQAQRQEDEETLAQMQSEEEEEEEELQP
jgi:hypothetical protein